MKKKILTTALFVVAIIGSFSLGTRQAKVVEVVPNGYIDTTTEEFYNNYINMETVVDFEATETGLCLYTSDGSGYYWKKGDR